MMGYSPTLGSAKVTVNGVQSGVRSVQSRKKRLDAPEYRVKESRAVGEVAPEPATKAGTSLVVAEAPTLRTSEGPAVEVAAGAAAEPTTAAAAATCAAAAATAAAETTTAAAETTAVVVVVATTTWQASTKGGGARSSLVRWNAAACGSGACGRGSVRSDAVGSDGGQFSTVGRGEERYRAVDCGSVRFQGGLARVECGSVQFQGS
ncbi:unnamed protein product [Closterium sp. NIES-54]